jgi:dienelactone hydrolase
MGLMLLVIAMAAACGNASVSTEASPTLQPSEDAQQPEPTEEPVVEEPQAIELIEVDPTPVTFETYDGLTTVHGTLYNHDSVGIILSHRCTMGQEDQTDWLPLTETLAARGYMVLTYDTRGYGLTQGTYTWRNVLVTLQAAVAFMREQGVERLILIGAGVGGTASLEVAAEADDVIGVAAISSLQSGRAQQVLPLEISDDELARLTMPSLWVVSRQDTAMDDMVGMFESAAGPDKDLHIYEGTMSGTDILYHPVYGPDLEQRILAFVAHAISSAE